MKSVTGAGGDLLPSTRSSAPDFSRPSGRPERRDRSVASRDDGRTAVGRARRPTGRGTGHANRSPRHERPSGGTAHRRCAVAPDSGIIPARYRTVSALTSPELLGSSSAGGPQLSPGPRCDRAGVPAWAGTGLFPADLGHSAAKRSASLGSRSPLTTGHICASRRTAQRHHRRDRHRLVDRPGGGAPGSRSSPHSSPSSPQRRHHRVQHQRRARRHGGMGTGHRAHHRRPPVRSGPLHDRRERCHRRLTAHRRRVQPPASSRSRIPPRLPRRHRRHRHHILRPKRHHRHLTRNLTAPDCRRSRTLGGPITGRVPRTSRRHVIRVSTKRLAVGGAGDVLVSYHPVGVARAGGPAQLRGSM